MAHITYSPGVDGDPFDRQRDSRVTTWRLEPDFEVEHYLQHQGETFLGRFDSLTYLYLTRLMDYFDPFADEPFAERLAGAHPLPGHLLLLRLALRHRPVGPVTEQLQKHGVDADHAEIHSPYGHDSFLLDPPGYLDRVADFLA